MRTLTVVGAFAVLAVAFADARYGSAATKQSTQKVKSDCAKSGGTYMPPGRYGVYGCLNPDTSGIVCGGIGKWSKSCTIFKEAPSPSHLPTQEEVQTFEKTKSATK